MNELSEQTILNRKELRKELRKESLENLKMIKEHNELSDQLMVYQKELSIEPSEFIKMIQEHNENLTKPNSDKEEKVVNLDPPKMILKGNIESLRQQNLSLMKEISRYKAELQEHKKELNCKDMIVKCKQDQSDNKSIILVSGLKREMSDITMNSSSEKKIINQKENMDTNESVSNRLSKNSNNMLNTKKESMQKKGEEENEEDHKLACAYHTISEGDILLKKNKSFELIHPLLSFEDPNSNEGHCLDKNANNNLFLIHDDTVKNIQDYIINLKEENSKI